MVKYIKKFNLYKKVGVVLYIFFTNKTKREKLAINVTKFFQKNIKKAGKIEGNHTEKILDLISVRSLKIESIINEK